MDYLGEHISTNKEEYEDILKATKECLSIQELWMTLFQIAVVHKNLDLIKYLSRSVGYINAENSLGNAPLLMAIKSDYFEAVKILLDAGADVCVTDASTGKTALQLLMEPSEGLADMIPHIMSNLKKNNPDAATLAALLVAANCPLEHVVTMNDGQVTKEFLERDSQGNHEWGMELAMKIRDLENVELILRHGNETGRERFYRTLCAFLDMKEMDSWKFFMERLSDWDVISGEQYFEFFYMFSSADVEYLQVLLDCKIDLLVREKLGLDMLASIFGNRRVDAIELMQKNQHFNVNATVILKQTALHFAAISNLTRNVRFLLDSGADVDIQDVDGRTALFHCIENHCTESGRLLLEHGADVQVTDNIGLTVFFFARIFEDSAVLEFLLAQLALTHMDAEEPDTCRMKPAIRRQLIMYKDYKNTFDACCEQLRVLKTREVTESITLFDILTGKIETLYRFLRDRDILAILDQHKNQHDLHSLYYFKILTKLKETSNLYRFSCRVAEIISKETETVVDFDHLVVSAISGYLTKHDIQQFLISIQ